jgi:hypothetical protein
LANPPTRSTMADEPPKPKSKGGLFGDFGLGIGPGFNLHFDRGGVTASVGAGVFGRGLLGYAVDEPALIAAREQNRVFGSIKAGRGAGVGGEINYDRRGRPSGGSVAVGPVKFTVRPGFKVGVGTEFDLARHKGSPIFSTDGRAASIGFDLGGGWLHQLPTDPYGSRRR